MIYMVCFIADPLELQETKRRPRRPSMSEPQTMPTNAGVFLSGEKTVLCPYREDKHLELCFNWINDPEVRRFLKNNNPISFEEERGLLRRLTSDPMHNIFLIIETMEKRVPIGTMGLNNINWVHRRAKSGAMIGEKNYWSRGYGTDAKVALLEHAFLTLGLEKICSSVLAFNARSLAYLKKTGYREEGVRKRHIYRNGEWIDDILLAIFKEDFVPLWKARTGTRNL